MPEILVNVKSAATRKNKIRTITVPYPDGITDVRGLLEATVAWCVSNYNNSDRHEGSELLTALSARQIDDDAAQGKVAFGVIYGKKNADQVKATADALEAFSDGIAVVFADGVRLNSLDEAIDIGNIRELTFVRLTMLAGRMW